MGLFFWKPKVLLVLFVTTSPPSSSSNVKNDLANFVVGRVKCWPVTVLLLLSRAKVDVAFRKQKPYFDFLCKFVKIPVSAVFLNAKRDVLLQLMRDFRCPVSKHVVVWKLADLFLFFANLCVCLAITTFNREFCLVVSKNSRHLWLCSCINQYFFFWYSFFIPFIFLANNFKYSGR